MTTATRTEVLAEEPAESLAAVLDIDRPTPGTVPPLWHWLYLLDRHPERDLGPDGHAVHGIPAPPGPGRRRMFAGGRVTTLGALQIGTPATRRTRVGPTTEKAGRTGPLTFVTVRHEISQSEELVIVDEQDIVYRSPGGDTLPEPPPVMPPAPGPSLSLDVDARLLFRFSALTFNAHRIHYDLGWVAQEGYSGLVVHGPLQALMMGELMRREGVDLVGREFGYRLVAPLVGPQPLHVRAAREGLARGAEAGVQEGQVSAVATLQASPDEHRPVSRARGSA